MEKVVILKQLSEDIKNFKKQKKKAIEKDEVKDEFGLVKRMVEPKKQIYERYEIGEIQLTNRFSPKPFADALLNNHDFKYDSFHRFWVYDPLSGLWKEDAEEFIKNRLRKYIFGDH